LGRVSRNPASHGRVTSMHSEHERCLKWLCYPPEPSETFLVKIGRTSFAVPVVIAAAGEGAARRFVEFFTATIRNKNTRLAYARAVGAFLAWCEEHGLAFDDIESITVSVYIEKFLDDGMENPSVKQHLDDIRMMFLPYNPAAAVRGPRYVTKKGKTPVLTPDEARLLLDSIPLIKTITRRDGSTIEKPNLVGLRDRALLAVMVYSFARVSAVVGMDIDDY
jgi:integrase/recombinase XerD